MWSNEDKKKFLLALKAHGSGNLSKLAKVMQYKSVSEIRYMINKYKKEAQNQIKIKRQNKNEAPLDIWLNLVKKISVSPYNGHLYRALKYIALFEERTETNDINLRDCYKILADSASGASSKMINEETAYFFVRCIVKLARDMKKDAHTKEKDYLNSINTDLSHIVKSYVRKNSISSIANDVDLNTLKIPTNLLVLQDEEEGAESN